VCIVEDKYACSCDTYYRGGLICRHIFASAIVKQKKTLEKFFINITWQPPVTVDSAFQMQMDNFTFNTKDIAAYL